MITVTPSAGFEQDSVSLIASNAEPAGKGLRGPDREGGRLSGLQYEIGLLDDKNEWRSDPEVACTFF